MSAICFFNRNSDFLGNSVWTPKLFASACKKSSKKFEIVFRILQKVLLEKTDGKKILKISGRFLNGIPFRKADCQNWKCATEMWFDFLNIFDLICKRPGWKKSDDIAIEPYRY